MKYSTRRIDYVMVMEQDIKSRKDPERFTEEDHNVHFLCCPRSRFLFEPENSGLINK